MELTLFLDHACNLRCSYCYNGRKFSRPMSASVMKRALDLALSERPARLDVSFFGGEPLLHLDLIEEAIAHVESRTGKPGTAQPQVRFVMNTNGTLVGAVDAVDGVAHRLLALLAPPRRFTTYISLDGPASIHDAHRMDERGRGSFRRIEASLALLRTHKLPFCLVAVVRPDGARRLGEVFEALLCQQPASVTLTPDLRAPWTEEAVTDLRLGLRDVAQTWMDTFRRGQVVRLEPLHGKILTHLNEGIPCPERCTLAGHGFAVAPSGRLYPCAQMIGEDDNDTLVIGTVDAGLDRARLAELERAKDRVEETCAPCALRDRCQSHCGCQHWALTGTLGHINATLCELEESFIAAADYTASTLLAETCPSFIATYYRKRYVPAPGASLTRLRTSPHRPQGRGPS